MKKILPSFILLFFGLGILFAQEKPCIEYKQTGYTVHTPIISPILPGCESFKENNDSLNRCFGKEIGSRIARKFGWEVYPILKNIDSANLFKTKIRIDSNQSGKLEMKLKERVYSEFENRLILKLDEISNETTGIIPAKLENNYCSSYRYQLPIKFDLTEEN